MTGAAKRIVVIAGLLAIAALVLEIGARVSEGIGFSKSPPQISHEIVIERLREVAKLVASEMTLRDVVIYEQTRFRSTKRVRIDSTRRVIHLTLPPAQLLSVDVTNVTTYDESAGLLNPFTPDDRDEIQRRIRQQLRTAAQQSGILEHADQAAQKALTDFLTRDGYTIEITRPLRLEQPTG
jgi:HJR/Mrr/RecB family endonuclease